MRIVVVGSGYVGLVSGACFAEFGHYVTCVDSDAAKIDALLQGQIPIYEPGLGDLVNEQHLAGRLFFSADLPAAVAQADVVFIAVGTPSRPSDGHADLTGVYAATRQVAAAANGFTIIATKSTVPLGTGDEIERIIRQQYPHADVAIVSNPEFLREGSAVSDLRKPDRVVIGLSDERARLFMSEIYAPLAAKRVPLLFTSRRSAELIKYAANAFLAMKITFINEIADLCEEVGADVREISPGIGSDRRIGSHFLSAGPGFGGSCFPKDTLALVKTAQDIGRPLRLVETTIAINDQRKRAMARKVIAACQGSVRGKRIGILGLTFKPETDDMRGAPSLDFIRALQDQGAIIRAYDPVGMEAAKALLEKVQFAVNPYDAADGADCLVIVTEWEAFRKLDFDHLKLVMATPVLVDLRNMFNAGTLAEKGFRYIGVGCPSNTPEFASSDIQSNLVASLRTLHNRVQRPPKANVRELPSPGLEFGPTMEMDDTLFGSANLSHAAAK